MPRPSGTRHRPAPRQLLGARAVDPAAGDDDVARGRRGCSPAITFSVVVLPAPFGPSSATTVPARHREVDAVQHLDALVGGADAAQLEQLSSDARSVT